MFYIFVIQIFLAGIHNISKHVRSIYGTVTFIVIVSIVIIFIVMNFIVIVRRVIAGRVIKYIHHIKHIRHFVYVSVCINHIYYISRSISFYCIYKLFVSKYFAYGSVEVYTTAVTAGFKYVTVDG